MGNLILSIEDSYVPVFPKIILQTCKGTNVDNYQGKEISILEKSDFTKIEKKFFAVTFRCSPTPLYNCHGLTFASRRTNIDKSVEVQKIIGDDHYKKIKDEKDVLPGDIILYVDDKGDISHSGVVVNVEIDVGNLPSIRILSKWGKFKEVIHNSNDSPYIEDHKLYFRMNHEF